MAWASNPQPFQRKARGWTVNPEPAAGHAPQVGWHAVVNELAAALSVSYAQAAAAVTVTARARSVDVATAAALLTAGAPAVSASFASAAARERYPVIGVASSSSRASVAVLVKLVAATIGTSTTTAATALRATAAAWSSSTASAAAGFPAMPATRTNYLTAGAFTYTIPWWAYWIDVLVLGGGQGGINGSFGNGSGGAAGKWSVATLRRGVDIPWTVTTITGTVGPGGGSNGGNGTATTATYTGGPVLTGAGGSGGTDIFNVVGRSPGNQVIAGETYVGGAESPNLGAAGNAPGGGGAAGGFFGAGGGGGLGAAFIRARQAAS
ncbi:minor tail protein [Mycobacterium phage Oscar]|nr:minor tail protein [Mycobacterium phage Oscar]